MKNFIPLFIFIIASCNTSTDKKTVEESKTIPGNQSSTVEADIIPATIGQISLPDGYSRIVFADNSFGNWFRQVGLKKDKTVYLFDGTKKRNQLAQYTVVDMARSSKDLQQCADVVMRMRAEYLFYKKQYDSIWFSDYAGKKYQWKKSDNRLQFEKYLENVFGWCGSASLEKQLKPVQHFSDIQVGDVLVKGGFPGHAMIVADMAINNEGEKLYLLMQGYMPAQDIHIVINPSNSAISPWYEVDTEEQKIETPEWEFYKNQLRRW
jgi:hypothetical protein